MAQYSTFVITANTGVHLTTNTDDFIPQTKQKLIGVNLLVTDGNRNRVQDAIVELVNIRNGSLKSFQSVGSIHFSFLQRNDIWLRFSSGFSNSFEFAPMEVDKLRLYAKLSATTAYVFPVSFNITLIFE